MPGEPNADLAIIIAQKVAKQISMKAVYDDGFSPVTKEIGGFLSDLAKVARLALAPIQYGAAMQDRYRRFIERSAQYVPEDRRVLPASQILGPVLEAIRYEPEGTLSDEAFAKLLSRAFDKEKLGFAHPAFPNLLRALSEDEILLLKHLRAGPHKLLRGYSKGDFLRPPEPDHNAKDFPLLVHPENIIMYCEHLESQVLIYSIIGSLDDFCNTDAEGYPKMHWTLQLQEFGRMLVEAAF